jgi:hypothetical protein
MEPSQSHLFNMRQTLDLARGAINRQQPEDALELLRTIRDVNDPPERGPLAAEHRLLIAEARAAEGNQVADSLFAEALELIGNLEDRRPDLEVRVHEHLADYLVRFAGRPSAAREHYESAKRIAVEQRLSEDSARLQLKLIPIALQTDHDETGLENFRTFKRVASRGHFTNQIQLAAWHQFEGQIDAAQRGLRFARKKTVVSEEYFRHILESVRDLSA